MKIFHISDDFCLPGLKRDILFCSLTTEYASYFCKLPLESLEHADYKVFILTMAKRNLRDSVLNGMNFLKLSLVFVKMDSPDFELTGFFIYIVFFTNHGL
jgi:hypothetical protein